MLERSRLTAPLEAVGISVKLIAAFCTAPSEICLAIITQSKSIQTRYTSFAAQASKHLHPVAHCHCNWLHGFMLTCCFRHTHTELQKLQPVHEKSSE